MIVWRKRGERGRYRVERESDREFICFFFLVDKIQNPLYCHHLENKDNG